MSNEFVSVFNRFSLQRETKPPSGDLGLTSNLYHFCIIVKNSRLLFTQAGLASLQNSEKF